MTSNIKRLTVSYEEYYKYIICYRIKRFSNKHTSAVCSRRINPSLVEAQRRLCQLSVIQKYVMEKDFRNVDGDEDVMRCCLNSM